MNMIKVHKLEASRTIFFDKGMYQVTYGDSYNSNISTRLFISYYNIEYLLVFLGYQTPELIDQYGSDSITIPGLDLIFVKRIKTNVINK